MIELGVLIGGLILFFAGICFMGILWILEMDRVRKERCQVCGRINCYLHKEKTIETKNT